MKKHYHVFSSLFFSAAIMLSACSGGGGGGGNPQPTATYLYYFNTTTGGLFFYDFATKATTTIEDGTLGHKITGGGSEFIGGTYSYASKQLTDAHLRTLVFAKDDGKLYKVSLLKSGTHTASQLSSEATGSVICGNNSIPDFANPDNSIYAYELPGPDGSCGSPIDLNPTLDNVWRAVRLNMSATDAPMEITALNKKPVTEIRDWSTAGITGEVAVDHNTQSLVKCTTDFASQNCADILTAPTNTVEDAGLLGSDITAKQIYLWVFDGTEYQVRTYDTVSNNISNPVYTTTSGISGHSQDNNAIYFGVNNTLTKITFGTTHQVISLFTVTTPLKKDTTPVLSDNSFLYVAREDLSTGATETAFKLISVLKSEVTVTPTVLAQDPENVDLVVVAGDRVFYNLGSWPTATAGSVKDNNTGRQEASGARWTAASYSPTLTVPSGTAIPLKVIMSKSNGELWSYDTTATATAYSPTATAYSPGTGLYLGTMPGASMDTFYGGGVGSDILGFSGNWDAFDIFTVNVNTVDSLSRVTDTSDNEQPFF